MSYHTVGTCSLCKGPVVIPSLWGSVLPPTPTCSRCGAISAQYGPVIEMVKPVPNIPVIKDDVWLVEKDKVRSDSYNDYLSSRKKEFPGD